MSAGCSRGRPKLRAVVNGDLDDCRRYYKNRCPDERHLARYDPASAEGPGLTGNCSRRVRRNCLAVFIARIRFFLGCIHGRYLRQAQGSL